MFTNPYVLERLAREFPEERLAEVQSYRRSKQAAKISGSRLPSTNESGSEDSRPVSRLLSFWAMRILR